MFKFTGSIKGLRVRDNNYNRINLKMLSEIRDILAGVIVVLLNNEERVWVINGPPIRHAPRTEC